MPRVVLIVPGDIETRTGGYIYDKRIAEGLRALGWSVDVRQSDFNTIDDGTTTVVDGLALLTLGDEVARHAHRLRIVPLIHLPLALEVGLASDEAARRDAIERRALRCARHIVVTGAFTADALTRRGFEPSRIAIVEPGTDRAPLANGSARSDVALLSVGAVTPGKGHEILLRALATVPSRNWTLTCAGSLDRDRATVDRVGAIVADLGLCDRVTLTGDLDAQRLAAEYDRADVFVLPTLRETFGMAIAEAIACGLPVVSTRVGAIPTIVADGGILVEAGDREALTMALTRAITSDATRRELARGARAARERLASWDEASRKMAEILTQVEAHG